MCARCEYSLIVEPSARRYFGAWTEPQLSASEYDYYNFSALEYFRNSR